MLKLPIWLLLFYILLIYRYRVTRETIGWKDSAIGMLKLLSIRGLAWYELNLKTIFSWVLTEIWPWILHCFDQLILIDTKSLETRSQSIINFELMTCLNSQGQTMIASFWNALELFCQCLSCSSYMDGLQFLFQLLDLLLTYLHSAYEWPWDVLTSWLLWMVS